MRTRKKSSSLFLSLLLVITPVHASMKEESGESAEEKMQGIQYESEEDDSSLNMEERDPSEAGEKTGSDPDPEEADQLPDQYTETKEDHAFLTEGKEEENESEPSFEWEERELDQNGKALLKDHHCEEMLLSMQEGKDFAEKELVFYTDDLSSAEEAAKLYQGTLVSCQDGVAVIRISENNSVASLVLSSWQNEALPLVEPNYYLSMDLEEEKTETWAEDGSVQTVLPVEKKWETYVYEQFDQPDPLLLYPSSRSYQWFHEEIGTYYGWNATMGKKEVTVAVIDYSVNADHTDLKGKVLTEDIGCGACLGNGHGTMVAGIIAAKNNNGEGGSGIAPDVTILSINIFKESSRAKSSDICSAIIRAVDCGADVINFSAGSNQYSFVEETAVNYAITHGVPIVSAAGNNASDALVFPACLDPVIAVAASDRNHALASFSSDGPWVTVYAPGTEITSTISSESDPSSRYASSEGSSFAAPVVSGALALYISKAGHLSPMEAKKLLENSRGKTGIVSVERMFAADQAECSLKVFDGEGNEITSFESPLPKGAMLEMKSMYGGTNDVILFTDDQSKPMIQNGEVKRGMLVDSGTVLSLDAYSPASTITFEAAAISSMGAMGKTEKLTVKTPVEEEADQKIRTVKLSEDRIRLVLPERGTGKITAASLINTDGETVSLEKIAHCWISSDPDTVTVDSEGNVHAKKKGSAKITLKLLDGSKKSAVCTVVVSQMAEEVVILGQSSIAPGCTAAYKGTVLPSSAENRKVIWSIVEKIEGVTVKNGTVKVRKGVAPGTVFTLRAEGKDSDGVIGTKTITISPKASSIRIECDDPRGEYDRNGKLKAALLFTSDLRDSDHPLRDHQISLHAEIVGNDISPIWKSSSPNVAKVDPDGTVTAVGEGTAVITCMADDGSGKKASVKITVRVPVSSLTLSSGKKTNLALGQSMNLSEQISYGSAYGNPTMPKVNWSVSSVFCSGESGAKEITEKALSSRSVFLKGSRLYVSERLNHLADLSNGQVTVTVRADMKDGTDYYAEETLTITKPLKGLVFDDSAGAYLDCEPDSVNTVLLFSETPIRFDLKSDHPTMAGGVIDYSSRAPTEFEYVRNGRKITAEGYFYRVRIYTYPDSEGIVIFTASALDGSKKKAKLKVRIV